MPLLSFYAEGAEAPMAKALPYAQSNAYPQPIVL
jgi:hypothetical protein